MARQMLLAATPTAYQNLLRQSASLKPVAPDVWECSVRYGGVKMPEKGDWRWEFDTTGGTQKVTQSKENVHNYAPSGKTAPDYHGRHRRDRRFGRGLRRLWCLSSAGPKPTSSTPDEVTWDYSQTLYDLTGKTNDDDFRGFSARQVLFHGGKGSQSAKNPDLVEMTFIFAASRDATGLSVGDIRASPKRLGVPLGALRDVADADAKKLVKRPTCVHVERVYDSGDFSQLGDRVMTSAGGNKFAKVRSGERRILPADVWNAMLDTIDYVQGLRESGGAMARAGASPVCVDAGQNNTGSDLLRFAVVGIDSPVFGPDENADEFQSLPSLNGVTPELGSHLGNFAVLVEPVAVGDVGLAVVTGVVPVKVYMSSTASWPLTGQSWYDYADIDDGQSGHLIARPYGGVRILWVADTSGGEQWALVRIGNPSGIAALHGTLSAALKQGSYADASLAFNGSQYTQRVYDLLLASGQSLPSGTKIVATYWPDEQKFYVTGAACS